MLVQYNIVPTF